MHSHQQLACSGLHPSSLIRSSSDSDRRSLPFCREWQLCPSATCTSHDVARGLPAGSCLSFKRQQLTTAFSLNGATSELSSSLARYSETSSTLHSSTAAMAPRSTSAFQDQLTGTASKERTEQLTPRGPAVPVLGGQGFYAILRRLWYFSLPLSYSRAPTLATYMDLQHLLCCMRPLVTWCVIQRFPPGF